MAARAYVKVHQQSQRSACRGWVSGMSLSQLCTLGVSRRSIRSLVHSMEVIDSSNMNIQIITEMKDSKVAAGEQASLLSRTGLHVALATSGLSRRHGTPDHSI
jgi:hypothetical protein